MRTTDMSRLLAGITNDSLKFADVIAFIEANYHYTPVDFSNGEVVNPVAPMKAVPKYLA